VSPRGRRAQFSGHGIKSSARRGSDGLSLGKLGFSGLRCGGLDPDGPSVPPAGTRPRRIGLWRACGKGALEPFPKRAPRSQKSSGGPREEDDTCRQATSVELGHFRELPSCLGSTAAVLSDRPSGGLEPRPAHNQYCPSARRDLRMSAEAKTKTPRGRGGFQQDGASPEVSPFAPPP